MEAVILLVLKKTETNNELLKFLQIHLTKNIQLDNSWNDHLSSSLDYKLQVQLMSSQCAVKHMVYISYILPHLSPLTTILAASSRGGKKPIITKLEGQNILHCV